MPNIVFEDRAMAFIDVLEFKSVVESFDSGDRTFLEELSEDWDGCSEIRSELTISF